MLDHKACLGKFKKIEINRLFQPQCPEIRNQLQEKNCKKKNKQTKKHLQAKQYEKGIVTLILWDVLNSEIMYVECIGQCLLDQGYLVSCS